MKLTDAEIREVRDLAGALAHQREVMHVGSANHLGMPVSPHFLDRALTELLVLREFEEAVNAASKRVRGEP